MKRVQLIHEVPGLYGTFRVEENVIQKIWAEQDFNLENLHTSCGMKLKVISQGIWNRTEEGPDFKNAVIQLNDKEHTGDIEIHFDAREWENHGHNQNKNFDRVILHVTLFPSRNLKIKTLTSCGTKISQFVLIPLLSQSLEEHMEEAAIKSLARRKPDLPAKLKSPESIFEFKKDVQELAQLRWEQKKKFAKKKLMSAPFKQVLHESFLEALGYRRNRSIMHRIAQAHPWQEWNSKVVSASDLFHSETGWKTKGQRPANHPKIRLKQYAKLWEVNPDWIPQIENIKIPQRRKNEQLNRETLGLHALRKVWKEEILAQTFGGGKIDTLWIDVCLPILSAFHGKDYFDAWYYWSPGDFPLFLRSFVKEAGIAGNCRENPFSNGVLQGALGYCIKKQLIN